MNHPQRAHGKTLSDNHCEEGSPPSSSVETLILWKSAQGLYLSGRQKVYIPNISLGPPSEDDTFNPYWFDKQKNKISVLIYFFDY